LDFKYNEKEFTFEQVDREAEAQLGRSVRVLGDMELKLRSYLTSTINSQNPRCPLRTERRVNEGINFYSKPLESMIAPKKISVRFCF